MNNSAPFLAIYRVKSNLRTAALALLATGIIFTVGIWGRVELGIDRPTTETLLITWLVLLCTVVFTLHAFTSAVRFTTDAVEKRYLLTIASIPLDQIRGRRQIAARGDGENVRFFVIVPKRASLPTIKFAEYHDFDDAFYEWFMSLPDLDTNER